VFETWFLRHMYSSPSAKQHDSIHLEVYHDTNLHCQMEIAYHGIACFLGQEIAFV